MTSAGAVLKLVFIPFQLNQKKNKKVSLDQVLPGVLELLMKIKEKVLLI